MIVALGGLVLAGCSNLDETQQRMLSGGAIGAGTGAVVTVVSGGCVACGAAIGAAVGAAGGYVVDQLDSGKNNNAPPSNYQNSNYNPPPPSGSGAGYTNVNPPTNVYQSAPNGQPGT
jgi:hypothetical protein